MKNIEERKDGINNGSGKERKKRDWWCEKWRENYVRKNEKKSDRDEKKWKKEKKEKYYEVNSNEKME